MSSGLKTELGNELNEAKTKVKANVKELDMHEMMKDSHMLSQSGKCPTVWNFENQTHNLYSYRRPELVFRFGHAILVSFIIYLFWCFFFFFFFSEQQCRKKGPFCGGKKININNNYLTLMTC